MLIKLSLDQDSIVFAKQPAYYNRITDKYTVKKINEPSHRNLFILSKICNKDFYENMPKNFTISTKNSVLYFNTEMLKETSPVISKFIQDNPNQHNYYINLTDDENVLSKMAQLYQGKSIIFTEGDTPLVQRFT